MSENAGTQVVAWRDESLPAADRLKALTALAHGGEAERGTYAASQDLVRELHRQVHGAGPALLVGGPVDQAAIAQREDRMRELMKDAHRDDDASRRRYAAAQPELMQLAAEIEALKRGEKLSPAARPETPAKPKPANVTEYGDLPVPDGQTENDVIDDRLWSEALPVFADLGLQPGQVAGLGDLFRKLEVTAERLRAEEVAEVGQQMFDETYAALHKVHGDRTDAVLNEANEVLRRLAPNGASKRLANLPLAGGGVLGSHPGFVQMLVSLRGKR
ncbi:MAG TPA: hypothetical protein VH913_14135 [Hyphomicrobiaceae bacterium]|jgi:hypothetical protein